LNTRLPDLSAILFFFRKEKFDQKKTVFLVFLLVKLPMLGAPLRKFAGSENLQSFLFHQHFSFFLRKKKVELMSLAL